MLDARLFLVTPGSPRLVGTVFTLRFVPGRGDLGTPASWSSPPTRAAIEAIPEDCIAEVVHEIVGGGPEQDRQRLGSCRKSGGAVRMTGLYPSNAEMLAEYKAARAGNAPDDTHES